MVDILIDYCVDGPPQLQLSEESDVYILVVDSNTVTVCEERQGELKVTEF